jgi:hypothetical protein
LCQTYLICCTVNIVFFASKIHSGHTVIGAWSESMGWTPFGYVTWRWCTTWCSTRWWWSSTTPWEVKVTFSTFHWRWCPWFKWVKITNIWFLCLFSNSVNVRLRICPRGTL